MKKNDFYRILCFTFAAMVFISGSAQAKTNLPLQVHGQFGFGATLPYGSVVVPTGHEASIKVQETFHIGAGASFMFQKKLGAQLFLGYQSMDLAIKYTGSVYNNEYIYGLSFWEMGAGVLGYWSFFRKFDFYYEGGLFYAMQTGSPSLHIDGQEQTSGDAGWDKGYNFSNDLGLFLGGGVKLPIPDPKNRLFFQAGIRYKIGIMPIIEGDTSLSYNQEKDKIRSMEIALHLALLYKLF